jgi:hypothetical protein
MLKLSIARPRGTPRPSLEWPARATCARTAATGLGHARLAEKTS